MAKALESKRAILRRWRISDLAQMHLLEADPQIMRFTPSRVPQTLAETRERLAGQIAKQNSFEPFGIWLAESKQGAAFIGWFMLMPRDEGVLELGFMLPQSMWGKGFATEICKVLLDFAGKVKIVAKTDLDNEASVRVLEKLGFQFQEFADGLRVFVFEAARIT